MICNRPLVSLRPGVNPINASSTARRPCLRRFQANSRLNRVENTEYIWRSVRCTVQAQVDAEGRVNLVHTGSSFGHLQRGSRSSFRVRWHHGEFPSTTGALSDCDRASGCSVVGDTCVCDTVATRTAVFIDASAPPTREQIESQLFVGSVPPNGFGSSRSYEQCVSVACAAVAGEVGIFTPRSSNGAFDMDTIFRIAVNGSARVLHLANVAHSVRLVGSAYTFRNVATQRLKPWTSRLANRSSGAVRALAWAATNVHGGA
jgi:hypothetical protein